MKGSENQKRGLESVCHFFLSAPRPSLEKERVTIQAAARILGVSKGTIITYLNRGLLTRIKENGRIFIKMDEIKGLGGDEKNHSGLPPDGRRAKHKELEGLKIELDNLKQNFQDQSSELAEIKIRIEQLEKNDKGHKDSKQ